MHNKKNMGGQITPYQLHVAKWKDCRRCGELEPCCNGRPTFARGSRHPDVVYIGEAPGMSEQAMGRPFVGPAGNLLDQIIKEAKKTSPHTHSVTNIVSCRPPNNRDPTKDEIINCNDKLLELLTVLHPKGIVFLGAVSVSSLTRISSAHANIKSATILANLPAIRIMHPAAMLRQEPRLQFYFQQSVSRIVALVKSLS